MSPEYINKGIVSTKSDIFSLGVIIIEIVTGRRDYPDDTGTPSEEFIEIVRKLYFDFQGRVAFLRERWCYSLLRGDILYLCDFAGTA